MNKPGCSRKKTYFVFKMIELSTKFRRGVVGDLLRTTKGVKKLKQGESKINFKIMFPNLGGTAEWKLIVFSDAAHANLCDGINSMRGHLVLLTGLSRRCCPFSWQTNKIKGVVRSTVAADTLSLQERLEDRIYLCKLLEGL